MLLINKKINMNILINCFNNNLFCIYEKETSKKIMYAIYAF